MNKYNTKLGQLLSLLERPRFEKCVKATGADKHCKGFSAWQQFVTMAYAQIANPHGLRSLENSLNANKTCLYHLGVKKDVKRATISYANNARKPEVFEKLFYSLSSALDRNGRKKFRKDFYGIDATELSLNLHNFPWATFRSTKSGVKIHLTYDINNRLPKYLFITNANEHENNTLKKMNIAKGCTVTFDKGYCNYAVFGDFCRDKIFFVTRLKENAQYRVIEEHESRNKHITLDRTIEFTGMQTGRKCPFPLRVIKSVDMEAKTLQTLCRN